MSTNIRVSEVEIKNFKNVINGKISFPSSKGISFEKADVLGIYGQNGSGKTAIVEAFHILKNLLHGERLPKSTDRLINHGNETASLRFTFLISEGNRLFETYYNVEITKVLNDPLEAIDLDEVRVEKPNVYVSKEEFRYKEMEKGSRPKTAIQYFRLNEEYSIGPNLIYKKIKSNKNDHFVSYKVNAELAFKESTSFLFRKEGVSLTKLIVDKEVKGLLDIIKFTFANNLFVINNQQSSLILANVLIPIHYKKKNFYKGETGYGFRVLPSNEPTRMKVEMFEMLSTMFQSISRVLKEIVPGLTVELEPLGEQLLNDGSKGVRAELIAIRDGVALPISCESDGIKKLISILSSLIVMYNDPNACIVIDELDAGIFEFLLGEIVRILNDSGKGQLLFTSHNLRLLEVLDKDNLVFTTTNPEQRYINLKGIKETNNIRDVYIRAIQLGTDKESVYQETDRYDIMDAFEEAGEVNHG
ncbi:AAA family ATPase [Cytobacillus oceanisediminis]|uniref:AAA family ATPase n=1 Tax=Cytobacillus oceanisediminis TaxID=665099 RepID=UPI0018640625|nr:AAA family ATPase [Cytobacillus oceanisediminis]QOK25897.1 AAA family ATPase [Cytobacillus oceanisediminis]